MMIYTRVFLCLFVQVWLIAAFCLTPLYQSSVDAFATGSGSCDSGKVAVGGTHLSPPTVIDADLEQVKVTVRVGGYQYTQGSLKPIPLLPGIEYPISVDSVSPGFFRGVFIRLEALDGQDMTAALIPTVNTVLSNECSSDNSVSALTHSNNSVKTSASGSFRMDTPGRIKMDVSVVVGNEQYISIFGYGDFKLDVANIIVPTTPRTSSPVTLAPIPVIISAPYPAPTPAPVRISYAGDVYTQTGTTDTNDAAAERRKRKNFNYLKDNDF